MRKDVTGKNGPGEYKLNPVRLGKLRACGWLEKQLLVQKNGLTGNIEEIWPDLGPDSGWLGGNGESWERGPYYLDGLIPLAWILDDDGLKAKAAKWIEWILESQDTSGFFGPGSNRDWWPRIVALKVMMQYHQATDDSRVLPFMDRYFRYQLKALPEAPFEMWGTARALEELIIIHYVYQHNKTPYLMELADIVGKQCYDWEEFFSAFPFEKHTHAYLNKHLFKFVKKVKFVIGRLKKVKGIQADNRDKRKEGTAKAKQNKYIRLFHQTHSVNLAMALKMPALKGLFCNMPEMSESSKTGLLSLLKYHGQANFLFSGDEHLNGRAPSAGSELCLVVEYIYSLTQLFAITGDAFYGDLIERVAYNSMPATFTDDMCAHQYVQQVNQIEVSRKPRDWYDVNNEANIFGLEPNFGCCAANMHQGWPKLLSNLFFVDGTAVTAGIYAPCKASLDVNGISVVVAEETEYPFRETLRFVIEDIKSDGQRALFTMRFRFPEWAESYSLNLNGEDADEKICGRFIEMEREFAAGDVMTLEFQMKVYMKQEEPQGISLHRGPLLFALPIEGDWNVLRGSRPFADYEIFPASSWQYALVPDALDRARVQCFSISSVPFSEKKPPVTIDIPMAPAPQWKAVHNSAGPVPPPYKTEPENLRQMVLVPYGSTRLRIAHFPMAFFEKDTMQQ